MTRFGHLLTAGLGALLMLAPAFAAAQVLEIQPALVTDSDTVERALEENKGHASTSIEGAGASLLLTYQASEPIEIFMVPLNANLKFVPTDFIRFTLPATTEGTAKIDLTRSPGWSPRSTTWLVNLLTTNEGAQAGFTSLEFIQSGPLTVPLAAVRHVLAAEQYMPSSYHALRGYRMLGTEFTVILGALILLGGAAALLFAPKARKLPAVLAVLLIMGAAYQLRFGIDLLRFTSEHLTGYAAGTFDEAGSVPMIADTLKDLQGQQPETPLAVYVCRSGTNYKEKLLRYYVYPIRVSSEKADADTADLALVMDARDWSLETSTVGNASAQRLSCNDVSRTAVRLATFPDGTILFKLQP